MKPITVLLADDHHMVREGFRCLLAHELDIQVVAEADNGRRAVELIKEHQPDVVVMDIAMPLLNGLEATRQVRRDFPAVKILILSAHSDDAYVEQVCQLGAAWFLLKQTSAGMLAKAIREVHKGKKFYTPSVSQRLTSRQTATVGREGKAATKLNHLSSREMEVLQLVAEGKPNKQIADELKISFKTVDKHRQHLMAKLNIHDTASLTRYAISAGIIENSVQLTVI